MESIGRAERIAEKLQRGLLPRAKLVKTWAGFGNGRPCDGCDQAILSADIEQELDFEDGRTLRLHDACAVLWRRETGVRHTESGMTGARRSRHSGCLTNRFGCCSLPSSNRPMTLSCRRQ